MYQINRGDSEIIFRNRGEVRVRSVRSQNRNNSTGN